MNKDQLPDILTAQEIADYLKISRRRVYELFQLKESAGGIRCFEIVCQRELIRLIFLIGLKIKSIKRRGSSENINNYSRK